MSKWDQFDATTRRLFDDFEHREVRVYNYSESYDSNTGNSEWTQSEDANSPIQMQVSEPSEPRQTQDATGSSAEVDAELRGRDDTGVTITPAGEDDSHPTVVEDTVTGKEYTVFEQFDEGNGLIRLHGVER